MAWSDHTRSRIVRLLKVVLPLASIVLLSMLFLLWEGRDSGRNLPYSEVDIEALLRLPRLSAPAYSGVTQDGATIRVTAQSAEPGATGGTATSPELQIVAVDGTRIVVKAAEARLDTDRQTLLLSGGFSVETDTGYRVDGGSVLAILDQTWVESTESVLASGPQGKVTAGSFRIDRPTGTGQEVIHFKNGVKLVYTPALNKKSP